MDNQSVNNQHDINDQINIGTHKGDINYFRAGKNSPFFPPYLLFSILTVVSLLIITFFFNAGFIERNGSGIEKEELLSIGTSSFYTMTELKGELRKLEDRSIKFEDKEELIESIMLRFEDEALVRIKGQNSGIVLDEIRLESFLKQLLMKAYPGFSMDRLEQNLLVIRLL